MLRQVRQQAVHLCNIGTVNKVPPLLFDSNKPGMRQFFQMKRQGAARNAKLVCHDAGHKPLLTLNHQRAKHTQTLFMSQSGQS